MWFKCWIRTNIFTWSLVLASFSSLSLSLSLLSHNFSQFASFTAALMNYLSSLRMQFEFEIVCRFPAVVAITHSHTNIPILLFLCWCASHSSHFEMREIWNEENHHWQTFHGRCSAVCSKYHSNNRIWSETCITNDSKKNEVLKLQYSFVCVFGDSKAPSNERFSPGI